MLSDPMSLEQFKTEAKKLKHRVIRRDGEAAWRPLEKWKGFEATKPPQIVYYLQGNRVLVRTEAEEENWYTLS